MHPDVVVVWVGVEQVPQASEEKKPDTAHKARQN